MRRLGQLLPVLLLARAAGGVQPLWLVDLNGDGHLDWCFETPLEQPECATTSITSTSITTSSGTTSSTTATSTTGTTTSTVTSTDTTCFKYDDCYDTCNALAECSPAGVSVVGGAVCPWCATDFCPTCPFAHMCDMTCGFCATDITETNTSLTTASTTTQSTTTVTTSLTHSLTSTTSATATSLTDSFTTTMTVTSETECMSVNIWDDALCITACQGDNCDRSVCDTLFCPNCNSVGAGMCDRECGFCTTLTNTSTQTSETSLTDTSLSSTSATSRTTTETITSTTTTASTMSGTTVSSTSTTSTATGTSLSISVTTSITTTGTSGSTTTCFKYEDCIPNCQVLAVQGACETLLCPTCEAAHSCDTTCAICAGVTTGTNTSFTTTTVTHTDTTTKTTTTGTTVTSVTATTGSSVTTTGSTVTATTTDTYCHSIDLAGAAFCNATCASTFCMQDVCSNMFCPGCPSRHAGMCDRTCGFCTTLTNTSTTSASTDTTTRTTTSLTTTTSTSGTGSETSTSTLSTTTLSDTSMTTSATTSHTTTTRSDLTATQTSFTATLSSTTCYKLDDCLGPGVCEALSPDCDINFCPTCPSMHLCDTTCGFCYTNSTTTETSSTISTTPVTTSATSTSTLSTGTNTTGSTTTSVTSTSITSGTTTTTETRCDAINMMNDSFCEDTCQGNNCPEDICQRVFCPTCSLAGACDRQCGYCYNRHTSTLTSSSTVSTTSATTASETSTHTCRPCIIKMDNWGPLSGCEDPIPCGQTCTAVTANLECMDPLELEFECKFADEYGVLSSSNTFPLGSEWASGSYVAALGSTWSGLPSDERVAQLIDMTGDINVKCHSCGISHEQDSNLTWVLSELDDVDDRCGHINLSVAFGPNVLDGSVNEDVVQGYNILKVSACSDPTTGPLTDHEVVAYVPKSSSQITIVQSENECACTSTRKYVIQVEAEIDHMYDWRLMVVPVLNSGVALPLGLTTDIIKDRCAFSHKIELEWCTAETPLDTQTTCTSTTTSASSFTMSFTTTRSDTTTRTTSGTTFTQTATCDTYPNCWKTCHLMVEPQYGGDPTLCDTMFCADPNVCIHYHQCDTSCNICVFNSTTTDTSTSSTVSDSSTTTVSTATVTTSTTLTSTSASSTTTMSTLSDTVTSTMTTCYAENILGDDFCNRSCASTGDRPCADACRTLYCPSCGSMFAGKCDKQCGYCSTVTATSTSVSSSTATQSTVTGFTVTSKTTTATTTTTISSITTSVSTASATTASTTRTTRSTTETTVTTTKSTTTETSTATTCFKYENCMPTCPDIVGGLLIDPARLCEIVFCPTCDGAHFCDTSCGFCALNTTESQTSSATTGSVTSTTTVSTTPTTPTATATSASTTSLTSTTETSTTDTATATTCFGVNIATEEFCNMTVCLIPTPLQGNFMIAPCDDPCISLFHPDAPGAYAGKCDRTCGYCTTLTESSSSSTSASSFTRTTTSTHTSTTTSQTGTSTTSASTSSATSTTTATRTTRTTATSTKTSGTTITTASFPTSTETTTTCEKYEDCLETCPDMVHICDTVLCPTCSSPHVCDMTCGFCIPNRTSTTETSSSTATSETTSTKSATLTTTSATTTSASSTSTASSSTDSTTTETSMSETPCEMINLANDTFCNTTCGDSGLCPSDVCNTLFCPTCHFAGHCDQRCGYCSNRLTTTDTATTGSTSTTTTATTASVTGTCEPCYVHLDLPYEGCEDKLPCGQTCTARVFLSESTCVEPVELTFRCLDMTEGLQRQGYHGPEDASLSSRLTGASYPNGAGNFSARWGHTWTYMPESLYDAREAELVSMTSDFDVNCKVCGFPADELDPISQTVVLNDTDPTPLQVSVELKWGPNIKDGVVNEEIVAGYAVFLVEYGKCYADFLGHTVLSEALAFVPAQHSHDGQSAEVCACSLGDTYSETITATLPDEGDYSLMVALVVNSTLTPPAPAPPPSRARRLQTAGYMSGSEVIPIGVMTAVIHDYKITSTTTETQTTTTLGNVVATGTLVFQAPGGSVNEGALTNALAAFFGVGEQQVHLSQVGLSEQTVGSYWLTYTLGSELWQSLAVMNAVRNWDPVGFSVFLSAQTGMMVSGSRPSAEEATTTKTSGTQTTFTTQTTTQVTITTTVTTVTGTTTTTVSTDSDTSVTSVTATSATSTATSVTTVTVSTVTGTSTTGTTVTSTQTHTEEYSIRGDIELQASDDATTADDVKALVESVQAQVYGVPESKVTAEATLVPTRRLDAGRRLAVSFDVTYNVLLRRNRYNDVAQADVSARKAATTAKLSQQGVTVITMSEEDGELVTLGSRDAPAEPAPASSEASSSSLVLILGIVASALVLVSVLAATLCRSRLRKLLRGGGNNNNAGNSARAGNRSGPAPAAAQLSPELRTKLRALRTLGLTLDEGIRRGIIPSLPAHKLEALETLGVSLEEGVQMGIVTVEDLQETKRAQVDWDVDAVDQVDRAAPPTPIAEETESADEIDI